MWGGCRTIWAGVGNARPRPLQAAESIRLLHPRLPQFRILSGSVVEMRLTDSLFIPIDLPDYNDLVRVHPEG